MNNVYRFPRRRPPRRPFKRRFRRRVAWRNLTIAALLIAALVLAVPSILQVWHGQRGHAPLPATSASDVLTFGVTVVDGDTVRAGGARYRLVGFDTPEKGDLARCDSERALAEKATQRLGELIAGGAALTRVACACQPGTEGTQACNYGRLCGQLTANGRDVGAILIKEGLAHPYVCGASGCPRRPGWC
jgi:hypothetical protein